MTPEEEYVEAKTSMYRAAMWLMFILSFCSLVFTCKYGCR